MENGTFINHIGKDKVCFYNKEKLIRPKQFYYWNPSLIMLSCNKEQCECDIYLNCKLDYPNAGIIIRPNTFTYFIETDELNGDTTEFDPQQVYKIMSWIQDLHFSKHTNYETKE